MAGTREPFGVEELGEGDDKVEHLRDEEEHEGLAEVAHDARHGQGHPGKVGEGVADEDLAGVPVVDQEAQGHGGEGQDEAEREQVGAGLRAGHLDHVVD